MLADLVEVPAPAEPCPRTAVFLRINHQKGDASGPEGGIGLRHHDNEVGVLTVRDIGFRAVDDVLVAVLLGRGAHGLEVRAGVRFGHSNGRHPLAAGELG